MAAALAGDAPLAPLRPGAAPFSAEVDDDVALVVTTSGSTGEPRRVLLAAAALRASAAATDERLGGPGRWLLTLPLHHIAGLQVVVRSVLAGHSPVLAPPGDVAATAELLAELPGARRPRYASVVPTQLYRVVELGPSAWQDLEAILVGGAATPPALLDRARALGLRVVTTYGATETAGGCVYDGVPLRGVRVRLDAEGVIHLTGPMLARDLPVLDGTPWFRTGDVGALVDGVLHVHGRVDDMIITGGVKVAPAAVEAVLAQLPGVAHVCVVGVPDVEWGQRVVAVLVPSGRPPSLDEARAAVRRTLGAAAAPRRLVRVPVLPERGPGKVDRVAVAELAAAGD